MSKLTEDQKKKLAKSLATKTKLVKGSKIINK